MKIAVAFLLMFSVLIQPLSRVMVYVSFKINQDYIAKNICVNRKIPASTCQGSCQLSKQLQQQQEKEKDVPRSFKLKEATLFNNGNQTINSLTNIRFIKKLYASYIVGFTIAYIPFVFRPPKVY